MIALLVADSVSDAVGLAAVENLVISQRLVEDESGRELEGDVVGLEGAVEDFVLTSHLFVAHKRLTSVVPRDVDDAITQSLLRAQVRVCDVATNYFWIVANCDLANAY